MISAIIVLMVVSIVLVPMAMLPFVEDYRKENEL